MSFETIVDRDPDTGLVHAELRFASAGNEWGNLLGLWLQEVSDFVHQANLDHHLDRPYPDVIGGRDPNSNITRYYIRTPPPKGPHL